MVRTLAEAILDRVTSAVDARGVSAVQLRFKGFSGNRWHQLARENCLATAWPQVGDRHFVKIKTRVRSIHVLIFHGETAKSNQR